MIARDSEPGVQEVALLVRSNGDEDLGLLIQGQLNSRNSNTTRGRVDENRTIGDVSLFHAGFGGGGAWISLTWPSCKSAR